MSAYSIEGALLSESPRIRSNGRLEIGLQSISTLNVTCGSFGSYFCFNVFPEEPARSGVQNCCPSKYTQLSQSVLELSGINASTDVL